VPGVKVMKKAADSFICRLMIIVILITFLCVPPIDASAKTTYGGVVHIGKYAVVTVNFGTPQKASTIVSIEGSVIYDNNKKVVKQKRFVRKNNIGRITKIRLTVGSRAAILDVSPITVTFRSGKKKTINLDSKNPAPHQGTVEHDRSTRKYESHEWYFYEWYPKKNEYLISGASYLTPYMKDVVR
jgi:hypothetical protein